MLAAGLVMRVKTACRVVGFLMLSLTLGAVSLGQIKSGVIVGEVTDPNGAAIPGASVSAIDQETNVATTTVIETVAGSIVGYRVNLWHLHSGCL
jgi:hypothetical protein